MLGVKAASEAVPIKIGYCRSDIIPKCSGGLLIYHIALAEPQKF